MIAVDVVTDVAAAVAAAVMNVAPQHVDQSRSRCHSNYHRAVDAVVGEVFCRALACRDRSMAID